VIDTDCVTLDLNNVFSSTRAIKNQGKGEVQFVIQLFLSS